MTRQHETPRRGTARIQPAIARTGQQFEFDYIKSRNYAPHLGDQLPSAPSLIGITGAEASGFRYRLLSSVAHAQLHGLLPRELAERHARGEMGCV
jgi:hypothetical protein